MTTPEPRTGAVLAAAWLALALLLAACGAAGDDPSADDADLGVVLASGDVAAGRDTFATSCAACHGADLMGTATGPPLLHEVYEPSHHADASFLIAVQRGVQPHHWDYGPMPAIPGLSVEDVADVIAYVRQEQRAVGIE